MRAWARTLGDPAGHGLALLPRRTADGLPDVAAVPLSAPRVVHRTELVHHDDRGGPAENLMTALPR
jgi:hypothetical protein